MFYCLSLSMDKNEALIRERFFEAVQRAKHVLPWNEVAHKVHAGGYETTFRDFLFTSAALSMPEFEWAAEKFRVDLTAHSASGELLLGVELGHEHTSRVGQNVKNQAFANKVFLDWAKFQLDPRTKGKPYALVMLLTHDPNNQDGQTILAMFNELAKRFPEQSRWQGAQRIYEPDRPKAVVYFLAVCLPTHAEMKAAYESVRDELGWFASNGELANAMMKALA